MSHCKTQKAGITSKVEGWWGKQIACLFFKQQTIQKGSDVYMSEWNEGTDKKGQGSSLLRSHLWNCNIFLLNPPAYTSKWGRCEWTQYVTKVCLKVGTRRKGRKSKMQRLILRERESFNVLCHHHLPPLMKSLHVPPTEFPILHSALEQTLIQPPNLIPNAKTW